MIAECEARGLVYLAYSPLKTDGPAIAVLRPDLTNGARSPAASVLAEVFAVSPAVAVITGASRVGTVRDAVTSLT